MPTTPTTLTAIPAMNILIRTEAHSRVAQEIIFFHGGHWAISSTEFLSNVWDTYAARGYIAVHEGGRMTFGSTDCSRGPGETVDCATSDLLRARLEELCRPFRPAVYIPQRGSTEMLRLLTDALRQNDFSASWGTGSSPVINYGNRVAFIRTQPKGVTCCVCENPPPGPQFIGEANMEAFIAYITERSDVIPPPPPWTDTQVAAALGESAAVLVRTMPGERVVRGTLRALFPGLVPPVEAVTTAALFDWLREVLPPRMSALAPVAAPRETVRINIPPAAEEATLTIRVEYTCTEFGRQDWTDERRGRQHVAISHATMVELASEAENADAFAEALREYAEGETMDSPPDTESVGGRDYGNDSNYETEDVYAAASAVACLRAVERFIAANPTLAPGYEEPEEEEEEETTNVALTA